MSTSTTVVCLPGALSLALQVLRRFEPPACGPAAAPPFSSPPSAFRFWLRVLGPCLRAFFAAACPNCACDKDGVSRARCCLPPATGKNTEASPSSKIRETHTNVPAVPDSELQL